MIGGIFVGGLMGKAIKVTKASKVAKGGKSGSGEKHDGKKSEKSETHDRQENEYKEKDQKDCNKENTEQQKREHAEHVNSDLKKLIEKFQIEDKFDDIKHLLPLRQEYIKEVRGLKKVVIKLYDEGKSAEEIARTVSPMRRDIGIKYKDMTPPDLREIFYKANIKDYGDPLGPTIEHLRKEGKSWEAIIEGACKEHGRNLPGTK